MSQTLLITIVFTATLAAGVNFALISLDQGIELMPERIQIQDYPDHRAELDRILADICSQNSEKF